MEKALNEPIEEGLSAEFFSRDGIFTLEAVHLFKPSSPLTNVQVAKSHVVAATVKNTLLRLCPGSPLKVTEIEISRLSDDRVHNLFLDPMGWHTIISMQSGSNFYTNRGMKKVRQLTKAKDLLIDSVAWNRHNTNEMSTQEILIGTNEGLIFETVLLSDEGRFIANTIEQYWRQVFNLGHSVTGLEVLRHPPGSTAILVGEPQRCVILATTPSRMYQFAGWINTNGPNTLLSHLTTSSSPPQFGTGSVSSTLGITAADNFSQTGSGAVGGLFPTNPPGLYHSVFTPDDKLPTGSKVTEFPQSFGYSDLKLYQPKEAELPTIFAWMTGSGVYFGRLNTEQLSLPPFTPLNTNPSDRTASTTETVDHQSSRLLEDTDEATKPRDVFAGRGVNLTRNAKLIHYPVIRRLEHTSAPLGICVTAFHIVIVYADRVKAVNCLDDRTVYSMPVSNELGNGCALGVCRDGETEAIWLFGSRGLARLNVRNELCRIWQIYLDRLQFDEARKFCQADSQLDVVNMREAEHCFDNGDFMTSAKLFARTSVPFEEVALRFSQLSLQLPNQISSSPPILKGLAVTSDHDIMNAIVNGVGQENTELETQVNASRISVNSSAPLKALVSSKLEQLIERKQPHTTSFTSSVKPTTSGQLTVLALWLAELLITEIGVLRDQLRKHDSTRDRERLEAARAEFKQLMTRAEVLSILPDCRELLYELVESHGNDEELIFLAELMADHVRLIEHYMRMGMQSEALKTFVGGATCWSLMYDHAVSLVLTCPGETVDVWLRLGKRLDPVKLLPAIMLLPVDQAMRYLRYVVERQNCQNQAVHHMFISLCAKMYGQRCVDELAEDDCLMIYLKMASAKALNLTDLNQHTKVKCDELALSQDLMTTVNKYQSETRPDALKTFPDEGIMLSSTDGFDGLNIQSMLPYDAGFALRTCKEVGHLQGTVFILKLLGMHTQAVQTALDSNNIALAKEIAQNESLSQTTRRQLWLNIARHAIGGQSDIQEATILLRECPLLKLEDILPYFRDFVTVDQFKDAICAALDSYHQRIEEVKREMHVTMQSTNALRKQLDCLRYSYEELDVDSRCAHCNHVLILRAFYVFPCGHHFHTNCLIELVQSYITSEQEAELTELFKALRSDDGASSVDIQAKLDQLIASDCVKCGQLAIDNVSRIFFPNQKNYEAELAIWQ
ncbi:hypothetical protein EG68_03396 [Paragonimus skrjabini miyazakii]|uniref:Vacuolar protein sorting-associated protein 18 homolog n=1 Tax=Paragonimus skrjabini miyazakii TaxID=59628 RepID=A0A8S9YW29_9TREM|nr:hypothetical protein EG68_03396 [Paragonimus skrjabini miyazakii]